MDTATQQAKAYFERDDIKPHLISLVQAWDTNELLGSDLADQLRGLYEENVKTDGEVAMIDWNELAEVFAEEVTGVTEEELTRRREHYQQFN